MTTTDPTPTTADDDDDQILTAWCAEVAHGHHTYETREWAHYETQDIRDRALVEWTIRCLGNTEYTKAKHTTRVVEILAERHGVINTYADPSLRDEIVDIITPHAGNCQDVDCEWCDDAIRRADLIVAAVAARRDDQQPATS